MIKKEIDINTKKFTYYQIDRNEITKNFELFESTTSLDISGFLVQHDFRPGYFDSFNCVRQKNIQKYFLDRGLNIKRFCERSLFYVYNENTKNKFNNLIKNLIIDGTEYEDTLTILLNYPSKLPKYPCDTYGHSIYIKNSNEKFEQLIGFVSDVIIDDNIFIPKFLEGLDKYNQTYGCFYEIYLSVSKITLKN